MKPTTMSVFLDYKCNFSCGHCSVGSSPETKFEMPEEVWDEIFKQADTIDTIQQFVFTGGEVTLHKDRLLRSLQRASQDGYGTRIVTNGWWAHDMSSAREMIDELVGAGLDEINTSYDDFHTDFMDVEPVLNLVEAALEADLKNVALACIVGEDPYWDRNRIQSRLNDRLDNSVEEISNLSLIEDAAAPLGSGAQLDSANIAAVNQLDAGCNDVMSTISIHPDGSVKACCGHAQFYQPDLTLGNIKDEPLYKVLERSQDNIVYWLIHEIGPKQLIDMIDVEDDSEYTGICHACNTLLGEYREEFLDYVKTNKEELLRDEILLSDRVSNQLEVVSDHREEILEHIDSQDGNEDDGAIVITD